MMDQSIDLFSPAFLQENKPFFLTLFAIHFPFSEDELIQMKNTLPLGSGGYSMIVDSGLYVIWSNYGLAFNPYIRWTDRLKEIYYQESELLYAGAGRDEWFIVDFNQFPLNQEDEIEFARSQWLENDIKGCEFDDEGNGLSPMTDFGNGLLKTDFSAVSVEEIKKMIMMYEQGLKMLKPGFVFNHSFFERVKHILLQSVSSSLWVVFM